MDSHHHSLIPSPWVARFAPLIVPGGRVLDVACGTGRHARVLAERGHPVDAVDRDGQALAALSDVRGVTPCRADIEGGPWPYPGMVFAGIVVTGYLHRPLLPVLAASLQDRGVLIYETFMAGNERLGRPSNPDFLLLPDELLEFARGNGLRITAFEQGEVDSPKPAVVQRLCAVRGDSLRLP